MKLEQIRDRLNEMNEVIHNIDERVLRDMFVYVHSPFEVNDLAMIRKRILIILSSVSDLKNYNEKLIKERMDELEMLFKELFKRISDLSFEFANKFKNELGKGLIQEQYNSHYKMHFSSYSVVTVQENDGDVEVITYTIRPDLITISSNSYKPDNVPDNILEYAQKELPELYF